MIPELLGALQFRSSNTRHAPVIDALVLMHRHAGRSNVRFYAAEENVPLDGIVPADWRTAVLDECEDGGTRVERIPYELCVLASLREAIRRREVWVVGAVRWRNPDIDLPTDFDAHRASHYKRLGQPLDPTEFITSLRSELSTALDDFDAAPNTCVTSDPTTPISRPSSGRCATNSTSTCNANPERCPTCPARTRSAATTRPSGKPDAAAT